MSNTANNDRKLSAHVGRDFKYQVGDQIKNKGRIVGCG